MLSCNAMAPALSGGHCVTYCIHVSVFVWYISVTFLVAMSAYRPCFLIPVDCDVAHLKYLAHKQINIQPVQSLKISRYENFSQMMPIMK